MKKLPTSLSVSSLNYFLAWPKSWELKYLLGIKDKKSSSNLLVGSGVHIGLAQIYKEKPYINKVWDIIKKEGQGLSGLEIEESYKEVLKILKSYKKDGPYFKPISIEMRDKVRLKHPVKDKYLKVPFVYIIDLITEENWIIEHKTTSSELKKLSWEHRNQGLAYSLAFKTKYKKNPAYFVRNQIIKLKRKPRFKQDFYTFSDDELAGFFDLCEEVINKISKQQFDDKPMEKSFYPDPLKHLHL